MNREERRERRQKDTKRATITVIVFMLFVVLLVAGIVFAVGKFVLPNRPAQDTQAQTDTQTESDPVTEEIEAPVVPMIDEATTQAAEFVAGMTLEDKIAQMFVLTPEALTGFSGVTAAGDTTKEWYGKRPVGGIVYLSENLKDPAQTTKMLTNMQTIAAERTGLPAFLCVDEEGGSVSRIAGNPAFDVTDVGKMQDIGASGDSQNAYNAGNVIGGYLKELGFQVNFAPVADVLTNGESVIGDRSFGTDSQQAAQMVTSELKGLLDAGVYGTVKHFPGHGAVSGDSHEGVVSTERTLEELLAAELVPFQSAVDAGVSFVMAGHIAAPNVTGDDTPASLSKVMLTDVLRTQMGYNGIIITDAMNMKAITEKHEAGEAAVLAVQAGADLLLMPEDYETAYNGLLDAVKNGTLSEERINESLIRIVKLKRQLQQ